VRLSLVNVNNFHTSKIRLVIGLGEGARLPGEQASSTIRCGDLNPGAVVRFPLGPSHALTADLRAEESAILDTRGETPLSTSKIFSVWSHDAETMRRSSASPRTQSPRQSGLPVWRAHARS